MTSTKRKQLRPVAMRSITNGHAEIVMSPDDFDATQLAQATYARALRTFEIAAHEARAVMMKAEQARDEIFDRMKAKYPEFRPAEVSYTADVDRRTWIPFDPQDDRPTR